MADTPLPTSTPPQSSPNSNSNTSKHSSITSCIDAISKDLLDLHSRKANFTKPVYTSLQSQVDHLKSQIINFLLPLAMGRQSDIPIVPTTNSTYANIVTRKADPVQTEASQLRVAPPNATSSIIIKSSDNNINVVNQVSHLLGSNHSDATLLTSFFDKRGNTVLKFKPNDNVNTIADTIKSKLGLDARSRPTLKPKMTVTHIPGHINVSEDFRRQIIDQNPWLEESLQDSADLGVVFHYKPKDFHSVVLKMSAKVREVIIKNDHTLIIGNCACPVRDRFHITRCNNCHKFGHKANVCKSSTTCGFCSEEHKSEACSHKEDSTKYQCTLCLNNLSMSNHNHSTFSKDCPTYIKEVHKLIRQTDYGSNPPSI